MDKQRTFQSTHPWITFEFDMRRISHRTWMLLGEAKSKCDHLGRVPLSDSVARDLHQVSLIKGALATTAIEGNTLTIDEVRKRIEGTLKLSESREYLGVEIDNVVKALNEIGNDALHNDKWRISLDQICRYNHQVLIGTEHDSTVTPGEIRNYDVSVGGYSGAPPHDCAFLSERLCEWLNCDEFKIGELGLVASGILRAVIAHLYIAWIHPFGDGNGRTARLMEFQMLISSSVPTIAAHLLSNHYNRTRNRYYRMLNDARVDGGMYRFLEYAVRGFVDEMSEQLESVWNHQWNIAWRDFLHESLKGDDSSIRRKRHLVLDITNTERRVQANELLQLTARIANDYSKLTYKTLSRDLKSLVADEYLVHDEEGYRPNIGRVLGYMRPSRRKL